MIEGGCQTKKFPGFVCIVHEYGPLLNASDSDQYSTASVGNKSYRFPAEHARGSDRHLPVSLCKFHIPACKTDKWFQQKTRNIADPSHPRDPPY